MRDLNKVIVSGRAVKDAEYKEINETKIATFTLANNNGNKVNFFNVACFGGLAERVVSPFVTKGKALQVEGYLKQERFQDKEGQNRNKVVIIAKKIHLQSNDKSSEG